MRTKAILKLFIGFVLVLSVLTGCSKSSGEKEAPEPTAVSDYNAQFEGSASEFEGEATVASPNITVEPEAVVETTPVPVVTSTPTFTPAATPTPIQAPTTTDTVVITTPSPVIEDEPNVNEGATGEWE